MTIRVKAELLGRLEHLRGRPSAELCRLSYGTGMPLPANTGDTDIWPHSSVAIVLPP